MHCKSNGVIRAHLIHTLSSNEIIVDGSTQIDDGGWHFIVITYNGSSSASGVKIYVDGVLENLTIVKDTLNKTIQTDVDFMIGARTGGNYFSGQIDDVRIYSKVLSQYEIAWLNNDGNGQSLKTLNISGENNVETEYYIEIPHVGRVYDANLTLQIDSTGTPIGTGNITIQLKKEDLSSKISDYVLINYTNNFDNTTAFTYQNYFDLSEYVNNGSIYQHYGKFILSIMVNGTYLFDKFTISDFYIQTDTFVQAGMSDTEGWITNPAKKDTDDDGWDDYAEIFTHETNPLQVDTDGDGAWDPIDRDPHQDVMLEICPLYGQSIASNYKLQIVTLFTKEDTQEPVYIPAIGEFPDIYEDPLWTAYFDGTHGSSLDLHYYVNINDDIEIQPNQIQIQTQMWWIERYFLWFEIWDMLLVSGTNTYNIGSVGHSQTLTINSDNKYIAAVQVSTIGVEKANTIAIYETNGTVFNGHYQEQERMNIIQLYINDSGDGTPFESGLNTIVIPTSLFTETLFNAYVQNESLSETPIYSSDEEIFKFISVGRDGTTEQACDEIDFVIIRFDISSVDGMEILDLLLTCLVNETINETAVVYSYVSTKLNDTSAVMMNLPISVLQYVPWFCNFSDSIMGAKPETFGDWFWKSLNTLVNLIIGVIITIVIAIIELAKLIIDFFIYLFMDVLPILGYILWLVICAQILIFIFILFALTLILIILSFLAFFPYFFLVSILIGGEFIIKANSLTVQKGDDYTTYKYEVSLINIPFFAFLIPTVYISFDTKTGKYIIPLNFFTTNLDAPNQTFFEDLSEENPSQSSGLAMSTDDSESFSFDQFWNGFSTLIAIVSTTLSIIFAVLGTITHPLIQYISVVMSIVSLSLTLFLIVKYSIEIGGMTESLSWGLAAGSFFMIIFSTVVGNTGGNLDLLIKDLLTNFGLLYACMSLYLKFFKAFTQQRLDLGPSIVVICIGLIFYAITIRKFNYPRRMDIINIFIAFLTVICLSYALLPTWEDLETS